MKHIKTFEKTFEDNYSTLQAKQLKKYVLLDVKNKNGSLSIYEINIDTDIKWMKVNQQIMFKAYRLYKISDEGIKKINIDKKGNGISFRLSFILEYLIAQSDNIEELLDIGKLHIQKSKYNL